MTHEIKLLLHTAESWQQAEIRSVLATVVDLNGTSYRRPGVRMLINENGKTVGAVSGGCVEKEIQRQTQTVFKTGKAKMMTYDGRLRLGCEGILYILIEPLTLTLEFLETFNSYLDNRKTFKAITRYSKTPGENESMGTIIEFKEKIFSLNDTKPEKAEKHLTFSQTFPPLFQLYIFGAEHDAVEVCKAANNLGWKVTVVAGPDEAKTIDYFSGASQLITPTFDTIDTSSIDKETAIILMTHSFNKDVQYLMALKEVKPAYFGLLGSNQRRERVLEKFLEYYPDISTEFIEQLHGPAGINIGAETPAEIAVSILAEILSVVRKQEPVALREKTGSIHG